MIQKLFTVVCTLTALLYAGMDKEDSLYVRALLDANGLTEVKVGDVVNYDEVSGRVFSLFLSNVYEIYGKKVTKLPDDLDKLDTLLYLMVNDGALETLPDAIGKLAYLTTMNIERNRLTSLPDAIGDCPKLEYVNVANNELTTLPAGFGKSTSLYVLNVSNNLLTSLPEGFTTQTFHGNYSNFIFTGNYLCDLTDAVKAWFTEHYPSFEQNCVLDTSDKAIVRALLDEAGLSSVTPEMVATFSMGRVIGLNLSFRGISQLSSKIGKLALLADLNLENNKLTDLPSEIAQLTLLTKINVRRNSIKKLPEVILKCKKCATLYIDNNDLTELPPGIMTIPYVSCGFNRLCTISDTLDTWFERMDGRVYSHTQNCPIPEAGHPMLALGNSWSYTIIQGTAGSVKTDSLVREITIEGFSPGRDSVFTLEHDSGMAYRKNSSTFVPVDTTVERSYSFTYQKLVPEAVGGTLTEDLPLLINSDWNTEVAALTVDTLKVYAEASYNYDEATTSALKNLCVSDEVGLLGGQMQSAGGITYQVYLQSFNGTVYDSELFRNQVDAVSGITSVKRARLHNSPFSHKVSLAHSSGQRFDLLGRKSGAMPAQRLGGLHRVVVEQGAARGRAVLRLR